MKYSVITFGCRVNQADSLSFEEDFLSRGGDAVRPEEADVVVVNTCSVTASADQAARQAIRRVSRVNPDARIVVTGCYATRRPEDVRDLPNVVRVVPNDDKPRLVSLLRGLRLRPDLSADSSVRAPFDEAPGPQADLSPAVGSLRLPLVRTDIRPESDVSTAVRFGDGEGSCGAAVQPGVAGRTAFTLRVQTGCAEPCSYCIIPTTRGAPRSVTIAEVVLETERVLSAGFKEIALTGVHLGSYGRDLAPRSSLIELLRALDRSNVLFRISSLEPMDCTPEIVDLVAGSPGFAPHFHLPLQHASNPVLVAMRRPYTIEYFAALVDGIRSRIPHASIGSDVIVGFPGETDMDFECLAAYLERSPLTHIHVFPYSDRPGTPAAAMPGRIGGTIVRARARRLREISEALSKAFRESQVGTIHRGLTLEDGSLVVTGNFLKVKIPPGRSRNEWVSVKILEAGTPLRGHPVVQ